MKAEDLLDAVGGVDEKLIKESEALAEAGPDKRRRIKTWMKAAAAAACLGLVLLAVSRFLRPDPAETDKAGTESVPPAETTLQAPTESAVPKTLSAERRAILLSAVKRHTAAEEKVQAFLTENFPEVQAAVMFVSYLPIGNRVWEYKCCFGPQFYRDDNITEPGKSLDGMETGQAAEAVTVSAYDDSPKRASQLEELKGDLLLELEFDSEKERQNWYRVKEMPELKYLIREDAGGLSLWEFNSLYTPDASWWEVSDGRYDPAKDPVRALYPDADYSFITYGELYQVVYGISGPEDIWQMTAVAPTAIGTPLGQEIRQEIGTQKIEDPAVIAAFYGVIKDLVYNCGDPQNQNNSRFTYSFSTETQDKLDSGEFTRGGRYISLSLGSGVTIDSLKYNALSGIIYEWGGILPVLLTDEQVAALNEIFGIR